MTQLLPMRWEQSRIKHMDILLHLNYKFNHGKDATIPT